MHTLRELILGTFLAVRGLNVASNRKIDGKTPDWSVLENGDLKCIIEVVNFHTTDAAKASAIDAEHSRPSTGRSCISPTTPIACTSHFEQKAQNNGTSSPRTTFPISLRYSRLSTPPSAPTRCNAACTATLGFSGLIRM